VPVASLRRKPDNLSFDRVASVGVNYMAAWCGLEAAGLSAGETVLLIGAGGGVGGAAAQIACRLGARVIGADPARADHGYLSNSFQASAKCLEAKRPFN